MDQRDHFNPGIGGTFEQPAGKPIVKCRHERLSFGSGAYLVICLECFTSWEANASHRERCMNNDLVYMLDVREAKQPEPLPVCVVCRAVAPTIGSPEAEGWRWVAGMFDGDERRGPICGPCSLGPQALAHRSCYLCGHGWLYHGDTGCSAPRMGTAWPRGYAAPTCTEDGFPLCSCAHYIDPDHLVMQSDGTNWPDMHTCCYRDGHGVYCPRPIYAGSRNNWCLQHETA